MRRGMVSTASSLSRHRSYSKMRALVIDGKEVSLHNERERPKLRDDMLLVRPKAIALNPTDWKALENGRGAQGGLTGCDYAGIVEAVGASVEKSWKPGDRVCGCGHGANQANADDGVFAEYATVAGDLQIRIPDSLSFEEAATLPLGAMTVGQGLYQKALRMNLPAGQAPKSGEYVFIYGGSTATGALAIQYATLSGYSVLTTCSPDNFDYVKQMGATEAFDYKDADVGSKIRAYTDNTLRLAWDTISTETSANICAEGLSSSSTLELRYGSILPVTCQRDDVESVSTVMYTAFGKDFMFGGRTMPASKEDFDFGRMFMRLTEHLLLQGSIRPHAMEVMDGGLKGVIEGLKLLKNGQVRAKKLVYRVDDLQL